jgi:hypothetical protein
MTGSSENNVIDALLVRRTTPAEHDEMVWLASLSVAA